MPASGCVAISGQLLSTSRLCSRCSTSEREAPRLASWSPRPCMLCCEPRAHLRAHQGEGGGGDGIVIEFPGRASACTHCARDCDSARRRRVLLLTAPGAQLEASSRERLEPVDMPSSINCTTSMVCCLLWCAASELSLSQSQAPGIVSRDLCPECTCALRTKNLKLTAKY